MGFKRMRAVVMGIGAAALTLGMSTMVPSVAGAVGEPAPATPPPGCESGCEQVFNQSLPNNERLEGWRDVQMPSRSLLAYYVGDQLQDVTAAPELDGKGITAASCGMDGGASRCAITYFTGAHSEGASTALLTPERGIEITGDVVGGAPGATVRDLDGDSSPDAVIRQSTYDPNYADAPQFWETYVEVDGQFVRTGCTPLEKEASPAPAAPVQTPCA
jgi:hypothetical protein